MAVNFRTLTIKQLENELAEKVTATLPDQSSVPIGELEATVHKAVGQWGAGLGLRPILKCKLVCTIVPPNCTLTCDITIEF